MKRILAVCDDVDTLESLTAFLEAHGYEVEIASNGPEAIVILQERKFDLLLIDYLMQPLNGIETLKMIRADRKIGPLKVIIASSLPKSEIDSFALKELGVLDYIHKPFDLKDFLERIRMIDKGGG